MSLRTDNSCPVTRFPPFSGSGSDRNPGLYTVPSNYGELIQTTDIHTHLVCVIVRFLQGGEGGGGDRPPEN